MRLDPYKHKEKYLAWKERVKGGILEISPENSAIVLQYLNDMERGLNISTASVKGGRSYIRLNSLREKMIFYAKKFDELYHLTKVTDINEDQLISFFADMRNGIITRKDGRSYKSIETAGKTFKAFWHWHQKVHRKKGVEITDITLDLDTKSEKPDWVYLDENEVKLMFDNALPRYKALMMFLFDTGIRSPTELMNIKVYDLYNDFKELNIREEIVKKGSFGRRIKLMLCSEVIKEYVKTRSLKPEDYLFKITPSKVNLYLKRLAKKLFEDKQTLAGSKISEISMYDFRHISCCYWLPRYKSESALKYRFGWKKSEKIHYYSELLGMKDTITEDDILIDVTKTEIEKQLLKANKEIEILNERVSSQDKEMQEIKEVLMVLYKTAKPSLAPSITLIN